jgi:hypothetical protein
LASAAAVAGRPRRRGDFAANVQLQAARHAIHADAVRTPPPQIYQQAHIGASHKDQYEHITDVHMLILSPDSLW